jgi:hypothetical protein
MHGELRIAYKTLVQKLQREKPYGRPRYIF